MELIIKFSIGFTIALSRVLIPDYFLTCVTIKTFKSSPETGALATIGHITVDLGLLSLIAFALKSVLERGCYKFYRIY